MINIMWSVITMAFYFLSFVFLCLSLGALALGDWRRDNDVKTTMLIRLAFSVALILFALFFSTWR